MSNFRFNRRAQIFPGLSLNVSRSGPSLTVGVRGAHATVGRTGVTRTLGIPGTGLFWTSRSGHHMGVHTAHVDEPILGALVREVVGLATLVVCYAATAFVLIVFGAFVFAVLLRSFGGG